MNEVLKLILTNKGRIKRWSYFRGILYECMFLGGGLLLIFLAISPINQGQINNFTKFISIIEATVGGVLIVLSIITYYNITIKRLNDIYKNIILGCILAFIPYVNIVLMLYLCFKKSNEQLFTEYH
jgi:uncharacterized membrane protein YhaH (DUF805 family)